MSKEKVPLIPMAEFEDKLLEEMNKHCQAIQDAFFNYVLDAFRDTPNERHKLCIALNVMQSTLGTVAVATTKHIQPNVKLCRPLVIVQLGKMGSTAMALLKELEEGTVAPSNIRAFSADTGQEIALDFRDMMQGGRT